MAATAIASSLVDLLVMTGRILELLERPSTAPLRPIEPHVVRVFDDVKAILQRLDQAAFCTRRLRP